jgi:proteasome lid subunit RPN8/RPN11
LTTINDNSNSIKEAIKRNVKDKIKKELLEEIYNELKLEEEELTDEISDMITQKSKDKLKITHNNKKAPIKENKNQITNKLLEEIPKEIYISVKTILKVASHALKYANSKIPKSKWVEVIGLLAGKIDRKNNIVHIEDAYPMGHGTAVYAEIKDYKNFARAYKDIKKQKLFICGWYHSHPSYGCWLSSEDIGTQARYQKLWDKAIALVVDPYQINGKSAGFEIYRADIKAKTWYPLVYGIKGSLDIKMLPEILSFINPIIEGKAIYLEYDEV